MREVKARWADASVLAADIAVGPHEIRCDDVEDHRGKDTGANTYQLLFSALAACTSLTLRLYAERKGWPLTDAIVWVTGEREEGRYRIRQRVFLQGTLDAGQQSRLMEIATRCPIHRILAGDIAITTSASDNQDHL